MARHVKGEFAEFDQHMNISDNSHLTGIRTPLRVTQKIQAAVSTHVPRSSAHVLVSDSPFDDSVPEFGRKILTSTCNSPSTIFWRDDIAITSFDHQPPSCHPYSGAVAQVGPIINHGTGTAQYVSCKCKIQLLYSLNRYKSGTACPISKSMDAFEDDYKRMIDSHFTDDSTSVDWNDYIEGAVKFTMEQRHTLTSKISAINALDDVLRN